MSDKQYINVLVATGDSMQLIADVDFTVTGAGDDIHLADVLHGAVLEKTRAQKAARFKPGKYTARLLVVVVGEPDEPDDECFRQERGCAVPGCCAPIDR
jgi:hypothetical protein